MLWAVLGMMLILLLWTPFTLQIDAAFGGQTQVRYTVRFLFFRHTRQRTPSGSSAPKKPSRWRKALPLLQNRQLRRLIIRHVHLRTLDALILLHTGDAAATALLSGAMDAIGRIPAWRQTARIRTLPDFFRGYTSAQARCIIQAKLGTLVYIIIAAFVRRKEANAWNIPLAN